MTQVITVYGSNGEFQISADTGAVITSASEMPEEYGHLIGATADVAEHCAFWRAHNPAYQPDRIDILDIGFRLRTGDIELAESEWRADCVKFLQAA